MLQQQKQSPIINNNKTFNAQTSKLQSPNQQMPKTTKTDLNINQLQSTTQIFFNSNQPNPLTSKLMSPNQSLLSKTQKQEITNNQLLSTTQSLNNTKIHGNKLFNDNDYWWQSFLQLTIAPFCVQQQSIDQDYFLPAIRQKFDSLKQNYVFVQILGQVRSEQKLFYDALHNLIHNVNRAQDQVVLQDDQYWTEIDGMRMAVAAHSLVLYQATTKDAIDLANSNAVSDLNNSKDIIKQAINYSCQCLGQGLQYKMKTLQMEANSDLIYQNQNKNVQSQDKIETQSPQNLVKFAKDQQQNFDTFLMISAAPFYLLNIQLDNDYFTPAIREKYESLMQNAVFLQILSQIRQSQKQFYDALQLKILKTKSTMGNTQFSISQNFTNSDSIQVLDSPQFWTEIKGMKMAVAAHSLVIYKATTKDVLDLALQNAQRDIKIQMQLMKKALRYICKVSREDFMARLMEEVVDIAGKE